MADTKLTHAQRRKLRANLRESGKAIGMADKPKALFVEIPAAQLDCYKKLSKDMNLSMRDLVIRALNEELKRWNESNKSNKSAAEIVRALWNPTDTELAEAATARNADIAFPELVKLETGRFVQTVDVPTLKRRMLDQDTRIARLEAETARLREIVDGMSP